MCLPAAAFVWLGASAQTAATLSTVGTIAAAGVSAYGAYGQAKANKDQANYNAAVGDNNAKLADYAAQDAERRGEEEAQKARRDGDQLKGAQRVSMAAKGLDLAEGTAAEITAQTDFFSQVDQQTARLNGRREAWAARGQGANFRSEAAMNRNSAKNTSPGLAAATSLMGSASSVADRWKPAARGV